MIAVILAFAAGTSSANMATLPFPPTHGSDGFERPSKAAVDLDYEGKAKALRAEMRALQASDGGELTPQHRIYIRQKLEGLLSAYESDVRRVDPFATNADGSKSP